MTVTPLNRRRRKREREMKKAERRRERRTQGEYRFAGLWRPNRQRDTWHQSKERR